MNEISKITLKNKRTYSKSQRNGSLGRLGQACRHWASIANGADVRPRPPARDEGVARHAHHLPSYRRKNKYEARNVANPISSTSSHCQLVARGRHADSANAALRMRLLEIMSLMAVGLPRPPPDPCGPGYYANRPYTGRRAGCHAGAHRHSLSLGPPVSQLSPTCPRAASETAAAPQRISPLQSTCNEQIMLSLHGWIQKSSWPCS